MLTIELIKGYNFTKAVPLTLAAINKAFAGLSVVLSGTVGTSDISSGAVTDAKATPGAYWHDHAATWDNGSSTYSATLSPALPALSSGVLMSFKAASACNAASNLNPNLLGAKPILRQDATALQAGDIRAGQIVEVRYDAAASPSGAWLLTSAPSRGQEPYAIAAGTASAYTAALTPLFLSLAELDGTVIKLSMPSAPAAAATLNVNGLGAKPIVYADGTAAAVEAGEWGVNASVEYLYSLANDRFELLGRSRHRTWFGVDSGVANAVVLTVAGFPTECQLGQRVAWKMAASSTALTIITINAIAAKYLRANGVQISPGVLKANDWVEAIYDGTGFQLLGSGNSAGLHSAIRTSTPVSCPVTGANTNFNHELGVPPKYTRWVAVCHTTHTNSVTYTAGQEVDIWYWHYNGGNPYSEAYQSWADSTKCQLEHYNDGLGMDPSKFNVKCYFA